MEKLIMAILISIAAKVLGIELDLCKEIVLCILAEEFIRLLQDPDED